MPLVDGTMATRMIRHFERDHPELHKTRKRVPIIAVSASLVEENRFDYIEAGYVYLYYSFFAILHLWLLVKDLKIGTELMIQSFDGWILKPVNFARLDFLLQGLGNPMLRQQAIYCPGMWEHGGWFLA